MITCPTCKREVKLRNDYARRLVAEGHAILCDACRRQALGRVRNDTPAHPRCRCALVEKTLAQAASELIREATRR